MEANEQEAKRRLLAAALAAKASKLRSIMDNISEKVQNPQPGAHFVRAIAEALDAGETGITELKEEQRHEYNNLVIQVDWSKLQLHKWNIGSHTCLYHTDQVSRLMHSELEDVFHA